MQHRARPNPAMQVGRQRRTAASPNRSFRSYRPRSDVPKILSYNLCERLVELNHAECKSGYPQMGT